jgi:hypothetical protein
MNVRKMIFVEVEDHAGQPAIRFMPVDDRMEPDRRRIYSIPLNESRQYIGTLLVEYAERLAEGHINEAAVLRDSLRKLIESEPKPKSASSVKSADQGRLAG